MKVRGGVASPSARPKQALDYLLQSDSVRTNPYLRRFVEEEEELVSEFQHNPAFDRWRRKASFKKELTEAYGALARIESRCLPRRSDKGAGLAFVDLCAGRGMLSIVLARRFPEAEIHMIDNDARIKLDHLASLPTVTSHLLDLHSDAAEDVVSSATARNETCVVVGVHLCGDLSRRAVQLWRRAGAAALVLSPCCLPRRRRHDVFGYHVIDQARRMRRDPHALWCSALFGLLPFDDRGARCDMCVDDDVLGPYRTFLTARWGEGREEEGEEGQERRRGGRVVAGKGAGKWRIVG